MAVRASDGFDHYASSTDLSLRSGALQWSGNAIGNASISAPGRGGFGKCFNISLSASSLIGSFNANLASWYFGFAIEVTTVPAPGFNQFQLALIDPLAASAPQLSLTFDSNTGTISLYSGSGVLRAQSAPNSFNFGVWQFLEIGAGIATSGGFLSIQINGNTVFSYSGNTQDTTHASFGGIQFVFPQRGGVLIDDFRYNDTTSGPGIYPCNGFLGDLRVASLSPIGNAGVAWTPLSGTNWQQVSESGFDGDTSYNSTATTGAEDLFNFASLSATITEIITVQIIGAYREEDATGHTLTQQIKIGGVDHPGAVQSLNVTYQFLSDIFPINPTTAVNWTLADVNAIQAGYKAVS